MRAAILGLGESIKEYSADKIRNIFYPEDDYNFTIGVNDIEKHGIIVDYLVVTDPLSNFTKDRSSIIKSSKPKKNFVTISPPTNSHLYNGIKKLNPIKIKTTRFNDKMKIDDLSIFPHAGTSTFFATVYAYRKGATEIKIYGMDLKTHKIITKESDAYKKEVKAWKWIASEFNRVDVRLKWTEGSFLDRVL